MRRNRSKAFDSAVVVKANHFQFDAKALHTGSCVKSRMLLWCKAGRGFVRVNRRKFIFQPGDFTFFPWGHNITYYPDSADPFLVGGVHIIPHHTRNKPVEFFVSHNPQQPLFRCPYRKDLPKGILPNWITGSFNDHPALEHLAEYIVTWFQRGYPRQVNARCLGQILLEEIVQIYDRLKSEETKSPLRLKQMTEYVRIHIAQKITLEQLAEIGQCSSSTVYRLFEKTFGQSPVDWMIGFRLHHAARMLSTTNLPVGVIGRKVGIDDPYYFSKLFRTRRGMTAGEYRKHNSLA